MAKGLKTAKVAAGVCNVEVPAFAYLEERCAQVKELVDKWRHEPSLDLPLDCAPAVRTSLAMHWEQIRKLIEKKEKLHLETHEEDNRTKALDRLLSELDVMGMGAPLPANFQPSPRIV
jgi:predicted solute-binding protein